MPNDRLARIRAAYRQEWAPPRCEHPSQMASQFTTRTLADGHTERVRVPQKFVVLHDPVYCRECEQFIERPTDWNVIEGEHHSDDWAV